MALGGYLFSIVQNKTEIRMSWASFVLLSWMEIANPTDIIKQVTQTNSKDLLLAGSAQMIDMIDDDEWGHMDVLIQRRSSDGKNLIWEKTYGWIEDDEGHAIGEYPDGTIQVVGETWSSGNGMSDAYFMLLDHAGELIWEQDIGGPKKDRTEAFAFSGDGIIAVGSSFSFSPGGIEQPWIVAMSHVGLPLWQKTLGMNRRGRFHDIVSTRDGFVAVGEMRGRPKKNTKIYEMTHVVISHVTDTGTFVWNRLLDVGPDPRTLGVTRYKDEGYVVVGSRKSNNGKERDAFVLLLNNMGNLELMKVYGGKSEDSLSDISILPDGSLVVLGTTRSFGKITDHIWMLALSPELIPYTHRLFGTKCGWEQGTSILPLDDGTFFFTGGFYLARTALDTP